MSFVVSVKTKEPCCEHAVLTHADAIKLRDWLNDHIEIGADKHDSEYCILFPHITED